jgi:hypothetical protein
MIKEKICDQKYVFDSQNQYQSQSIEKDKNSNRYASDESISQSYLIGSPKENRFKITNL